MKKVNQNGEGILKVNLLLFALAGAGYAGYVYLWPMFMGPDKPSSQTAAAEATPIPVGEPKAGSMAGAAVQGAAAAGEVYGSGR